MLKSQTPHSSWTYLYLLLYHLYRLYIYLCIYLCVYLSIYRDRSEALATGISFLSKTRIFKHWWISLYGGRGHIMLSSVYIYICIYIYTYIYIYIYTHTHTHTHTYPYIYVLPHESFSGPLATSWSSPFTVLF